MVIGEHAVVYGYSAIVAAIEQRVHLTLSERNDSVVRITSEIADPLEVTLPDIAATGPYRFVLAAVAQTGLTKGCDIDILSDIDPTLGLGSSAAITVAALGALRRYSGAPIADLHQDALTIVRNLQGRGSGADLAASLSGGLIAYTPPKRGGDATINALPEPPVPLGLCYAGYKTPTSEVLAMVAEKMAGDPAAFDVLYARMGQTIDAAIDAAGAQQWPKFYAALNDYQTHMADLGVSDDTLDLIIRNARAQNATLAVKVSGSGLGDCVLALGHLPDGFEPVTLAKTGLQIHG